MSCESSDPLLHETVWLNQLQYEKAEADFQKLSLEDVRIDIGDSKRDTFRYDISGLKEETIWFKQNFYENEEANYYMYLAGTSVVSSTLMPGTPVKRLHKQEEKKQPKKQRQDIDTKGEGVEKKLQMNIATLSKTVKTMRDRLGDFHKVQQRKAQAIRDTIERLTSTLEACQTQLQEEVAKASAQLNSFTSVLGEIDSLIDTTNTILDEESWESYKSHKLFCQTMAERVSNLNGEIAQCSDIIHCFQPDTPKSDINRIVGEIAKLSLLKKYSGLDKFISKKESIAKSIKDMLDPGTFRHDEASSSEGSLEGSGSISDNSESEPGAKSTIASKVKASKKLKENKVRNGKANRNNSSHSANKSLASYQSNRGKTELSFAQNVSAATSKKRNAQGTQNAAQKKQEPFKFKGVSPTSKNPFMHQPGLLGPRPNLMQQAPNHPTSFRFSNLNTLAQQQQQHSLQNFGAFRNPVSTGNQSVFGNLNFNFASQHCGTNSNVLHNPPINFNSSRGQVSSVPNMGGSTRQSKMFQQNHTQNKNMKGTEQFGAQSKNAGFSYPFQRASIGSGLLQNAQGNLLNTFTGLPQGNMEQQLNEMSQKIQQMQLSASQNFQLQRLMQETERLKQMVAQKQHQQQDMFQHQFQGLINAFMQQQQQQLTQGPQSKMAKSVMFQNSQRQRLIQNRQHQLQQQKKYKQQQNKVQQVQLNNPLKKLKPDISKSSEPYRSGAVSGDYKSNITSCMRKKLPRPDSLITRLGTFDPQAPGDKHRAGISSMVVLDELGCIVLTDIINSCLKMYEVTRTHVPSSEYSHSFVTRLELPRPFYMSRLKEDILVISREGKKLSLVKVSKKRLEFLRDVITDVQYYGVTSIRDNLLACAAYTDNRIDLVKILDTSVHVSSLTERRRGPELVCSISLTGSILYLERESDIAVRLFCISQKSVEEFVVDLNSRASDVWNFTSIEDVIICSNKQSNELKLFSITGNFLSDLKFPAGLINHPFAMAFCRNGTLYIANDGDWDSEYGHFITTEINLFEFS
ncbi:hypothetical protein BgiMline_011241 [Biomphalaria glabrata]|nr:hypothetical protein BgiMline_033758 [Biomphalaria glabrata]